MLHACTVEDEAFVGMGATLLNGVVIEKGAFVAAGAVVSENTRIPAGQVLNLLFSLVLESAPGFFVPCLPGDGLLTIQFGCHNCCVHIGFCESEEMDGERPPFFDPTFVEPS